MKKLYVNIILATSLLSLTISQPSLASPITDNPEALEYLKEAGQLRVQGDLVGAIEVMQELIEKFKDDKEIVGDAEWSLVRFYTENKEYDKAIQLALAMAEKYSQIPWLKALSYDSLAWAYAAKGELDKTILYFEEAKTISFPGKPENLNERWNENIAEARSLLIQAAIDINPNTLNIASKGKWITCYIELPADYNVSDINLESIELAGLTGFVSAEAAPATIADYNNNEIPDLMVKFDRTKVIDIITPGDQVTLAVGGNLTTGQRFGGFDVIRVIKTGKAKAQAKK